MIGNDIVDLKQASKDSNWKRPRFLDKVFTRQEQLIISSSEDDNLSVWLMWSMKEAAYKAYVREFEHGFFNPKRIQCQLILKDKGVVRIDTNLYYLKIEITSEYVHSVASSKRDYVPENDAFKLYSNNQSKEVRTRLISHKYDKDIYSIKIIKTALGVPNLFNNRTLAFKAISLSHHGNYGAYAIC
ncbi:4'-phosphopantetheinyl transferase superfamily protein [Psychroserpens sp.]|uniref:4'-phosphopantetheinyl transferase family protein n=1 Tax=Psychroserpens sp. TaxID=2020870 RepID=UPI00385A09A7